MVAPKLKAEERFDQLLEVFHSDELLDEMTFRIILRESQGKSSHLDRTVEGLAFVVRGKVDEGIAILDEILPRGDANFAKLYCHILFRTARLEKAEACIYSLADKHQTKWLTYNAASASYLLGRLAKCTEFLDKHIKLLSDDEGREEAELFKTEAINDLDGAYRESGCTPEHLRLLGLTVDKVLRSYPSSPTRAEVSGRSGGSYIVEVVNASPKQVAEMNAKLADAVCMIEALDDCKVVARFAVERKHKGGSQYAYK